MKKNDYAKDFIVFSQENMLLYNWSKSRGNRTKRRQVLQGISNHLSDELGTKKYPVLFDREKCDQMDNTGVFVQKNKNVKFSYIALNENILLYDIINCGKAGNRIYDGTMYLAFNTICHELVHARQLEFKNSSFRKLRSLLYSLEKEDEAILANSSSSDLIYSSYGRSGEPCLFQNVQLYISGNIIDEVTEFIDPEEKKNIIPKCLYYLQPAERKAYSIADRYTNALISGMVKNLSNDSGLKAYLKCNQIGIVDQLAKTLENATGIDNILDEIDAVFISMKNKDFKRSNEILYKIIKHYILRSLQSGDNIGMRAVKVKLRPISDAYYRKIVKI